jgi:hypothetical protein
MYEAGTFLNWCEKAGALVKEKGGVRVRIPETKTTKAKDALRSELNFAVSRHVL